MEKKMWSTPYASVEQYMPQDNYASVACLAIRCETGAGKDFDGNNLTPGAQGYEDQHNHDTFFGYGTWHTAKDDLTGCGWEHNQYLQYEEREDGNTYFTMVEKNPNVSNRPLECTLYTDNWESKDSDQLWMNLTQGMKVFWSTTVGLFELFHWGFVDLEDETRPNRS